MTKQNNYISFILTKIIAIILISIALFFLYLEFGKFNILVLIKTQNYEITTYLGFIFFIILLLVFLLFYINSALSYLISGFENYREKNRLLKKNTAISSVIESAVLLAIGYKKQATEKINLVDRKNLTKEHEDYLDLINIIASSETIPVALYSYLNKFPFIKNQLAKKLAHIEFKLGNYEKAIDYAKQSYFSNEFDEEITILMAKIYFAMGDFKLMEAAAKSLSLNNLSNNSQTLLSDLYLKAAKISLNNTNNADALIYASNSLEFNSANIDAAELFAEIAASQKNDDLLKEVLLKAFSKNPNFEIFLIIKRYSNLDNIELYNCFIEQCEYSSYIGLFLAITTVLDLQERREEILAQVL